MKTKFALHEDLFDYCRKDLYKYLEVVFNAIHTRRIAFRPYQQWPKNSRLSRRKEKKGWQILSRRMAERIRRRPLWAGLMRSEWTVRWSLKARRKRRKRWNEIKKIVVQAKQNSIITANEFPTNEDLRHRSRMGEVDETVQIFLQTRKVSCIKSSHSILSKSRKEK